MKGIKGPLNCHRPSHLLRMLRTLDDVLQSRTIQCIGAGDRPSDGVHAVQTNFRGCMSFETRIGQLTRPAPAAGAYP